MNKRQRKKENKKTTDAIRWALGEIQPQLKIMLQERLKYLADLNSKDQDYKPSEAYNEEYTLTFK